MKKLLAISILIAFLGMMSTSCADEKDFIIDGKEVTIEPYGWFDLEAKNDSIVYKVNTVNIIWSVLLIETVVGPILITGDQLFEPVRKKKKKEKILV